MRRGVIFSLRLMSTSFIMRNRCTKLHFTSRYILADDEGKTRKRNVHEKEDEDGSEQEEE